MTCCIGLLSGCRTVAPTHFASDGSPEYRTARIRYQIDGPNCAIAIPTTVRDGGIDVAGYSDASAMEEGRSTWGSAVLDIEVPHPTRGAGFAQVVLKLSRRPISSVGGPNRLLGRVHDVVPGVGEAESGAEFDAVHAVDVPATLVDNLIKELETAGYFESQTRPHGTAEVETRIGRRRTTKRWTNVAAIEQFIVDVSRGDVSADGKIGRASVSPMGSGAAAGGQVIQPDVTESKSGFLRQLTHSVTSPLLAE